VIIKEVIRPVFLGMQGVPICNRVAKRCRVPWAAGIGIIKTSVQQIRSDVHARLHSIREECFPNHVSVRIVVHQFSYLLQQWEHLRLRSVIYMLKAIVRAEMNAFAAGIVAQFPVFKISVEDIQAKAIHSTFQPKTKDIQHCLAHFRIAEVQVRLFRAEAVVIVLI